MNADLAGALADTRRHDLLIEARAMRQVREARLARGTRSAVRAVEREVRSAQKEHERAARLTGSARRSLRGHHFYRHWLTAGRL